MNRKCRFLILLLAICCLGMLSGCREAPVLQQIIYSLSAPVDENQQRTNNDENNELTDPRLPSKSQNESSDVERDFDYTVPVKGTENNPLEADDEVFGNTREERSAAQTHKSSSQDQVAETDEVGAVEENEILSAYSASSSNRLFHGSEFRPLT